VIAARAVEQFMQWSLDTDQEEQAVLSEAREKGVLWCDGQAFDSPFLAEEPDHERWKDYAENQKYYQQKKAADALKAEQLRQAVAEYEKQKAEREARGLAQLDEAKSLENCIVKTRVSSQAAMQIGGQSMEQTRALVTSLMAWYQAHGSEDCLIRGNGVTLYVYFTDEGMGIMT